jgi:hypothetical protein
MATDNILATLAGRDSRNPMGFDELVVASGMDALDLAPELKQMCRWLPAPINCAEITRSGKTQMFYWPTGVVEKAERQHITINPKKRPTFPAPHRTQHVTSIETIANKMAERAIDQVEQNMEKNNASPAPDKVSIKELLDIIICNPGIKRSEVLKRLVCADGHNKKQIQKMIINATMHGRIKVGEDDRLHPGPFINNARAVKQKMAKVEKVAPPVGKLVSFEQSGQPKPEFDRSTATTTVNTDKTVSDTQKSASIAQQPPEKVQFKTAKSNARVMLEYLAYHGTATGQELCQLCEVESVGSYLGGPIKRGHLLVEKLGQTSRTGNRYTVAPGITRDELLADGRIKNVPPHKQPASEKPSIPAEPAPFEIPVIVAQPAAEIAQPETEIIPVPEDAPIEVPALVWESIELRACTLQTVIEQLQAMLPADITLVVDRSTCDIEHSSGSFNGTASDAQRTIDAIVWLYGDKKVAEHDLESVECA